MNLATINLALQHITETRRLLAVLIISSESSDYPKAKEALLELERKVRELSQAQAELESLNRPSGTNVLAVQFLSRVPERPHDDLSA